MITMKKRTKERENNAKVTRPGTFEVRPKTSTRFGRYTTVVGFIRNRGCCRLEFFCHQEFNESRDKNIRNLCDHVYIIVIVRDSLCLHIFQNECSTANNVIVL